MVHEVDPRELFSRYEGNPIIKPAAFPSMVNAAFNPAAVSFEGQTLLLIRVEDRTGLSRLVVATSDDGFTDWEIDVDRGIAPDVDRFEEQWGVEDPRITRDDDGGYLVVYTGYSPGGPLVCLAETTDFRTFDKRGVIQSPEDKDAALFPRKFDGRWGLIHRPAARSLEHGAHIWLSWSPDLRHWGDSQVLLPARKGAWWDSNKIGLGPPPLLTDQGWLLCYHGVRVTVSGSIYRLGLALLDRDDPTLVIARGNEWVFGPQTAYERSGDVPDVVFPCGWILDDDGETLRMYYGAADSVVCVATASVRELLEHLSNHPVAPVPEEPRLDFAHE
jgi:predicted GH43/DUF377 family glycosyl hydrolase